VARGSRVEIYIDPHNCLAFPSEKRPADVV